MIKWLMHCPSDEIKPVFIVENEFDEAMGNYCYSLTQTGQKGRIALIGIGDVGTSVVDKLYDRLLPIEGMIDSFSIIDAGEDISILSNECEKIYKDEQLILAVVVSKIDSKEDMKILFGVYNIATFFSCDNFFAYPLMNHATEIWPSIHLESINVNPIFSEEICSQPETYTSCREVPIELSLLRLYISALNTIVEFLRE